MSRPRLMDGLRESSVQGRQQVFFSQVLCRIQGLDLSHPRVGGDPKMIHFVSRSLEGVEVDLLFRVSATP